MTTDQGGSRAPAVRRALVVLDALAFERRARPADLARAAGLAKSSASDLIGTLLDEHMLARSGDDLILGNALTEIAAGFVDDIATVRRFGIGWERSIALREHTVTLQSLIGVHSVCVAVRLGGHVLPYTPRAGSRLPLWGANGAEPVLRPVPRDDIRRTLDEFPESSPDEASLREWAASGEDGPTPAPAADGLEPAPSATGNLEINAFVSSGSRRGGAVVATVHVAPSAAVDISGLTVALEEFAGDLGPRAA
ncbi:helix-turn-helix domain-containing protein [Microbacterium sp. JB110]|uniref:helix-turn-helix domain-containing protein n=1 Tax=unclassified Microbacterium TaxID=2609290 RepID=UPI00097F3C6D|nr:helix-turn-helix domain-containing protein [Microbacterium sp. JB110]SJM54361.1 Transcriptional regulator, IclR family [Frigoribacterium sp. JB110]